MANHDIDHFIRSLNYDPRIILAVAPDGDVSTLPLTTAQKGNNEVVVCKTIQHKLTKNLSEVAILSQGAVAFPGALLVADGHCRAERRRRSDWARKVALTVDLPGLQNPRDKSIRQPLACRPSSMKSSRSGKALPKIIRAITTIERGAQHPELLNRLCPQQVAASLGFKAEWASRPPRRNSTSAARPKELSFCATINRCSIR